ncbi:MAG: hypothetical protein ACRD9R_20250 [Pyrinomonadaceae bacterium]
MLGLCTVVGVLWWRATGVRSGGGFDYSTGIPMYTDPHTGLAKPTYLLWKAAFTLLTLALLWRGWKTAAPRWRQVVLLASVTLICFVEPFIQATRFWSKFLKPQSRFIAASPVTHFLQQRAGPNRVYTRVKLYVDELALTPRIDPLNLTALYGLHNVAGYEPLILDRYSRALGNVALDAVSPRRSFTPDQTLLGKSSHVLDLLNTSFVVSLKDSVPPSDAEHWRPAYDEDGIIILENKQSLPRAWLVAEAEAVDGEEALRRIRGEGAHVFDPKRTALLEISPARLPILPGGPVSPNAQAELTYGPNSLTIVTRAPTPTVLVVSEMIYPGWMATVDGVPAEIHATNFLLRGVIVPAGAHRVEMRYAAPTARNGTLICLFTLLLLVGIAVSPRLKAAGRHRPLGENTK